MKKSAAQIRHETLNPDQIWREAGIAVLRMINAPLPYNAVGCKRSDRDRSLDRMVRSKFKIEGPPGWRPRLTPHQDDCPQLKWVNGPSFGYGKAPECVCPGGSDGWGKWPNV